MPKPISYGMKYTGIVRSDPKYIEFVSNKKCKFKKLLVLLYGRSGRAYIKFMLELKNDETGKREFISVVVLDELLKEFKDMNISDGDKISICGNLDRSGDIIVGNKEYNYVRRAYDRIEEFSRLEVVDKVPNILDHGVLYFSTKYNVLVHLCPCGCGEKVVLPIGKDQWYSTYYDGDEITIRPSVGNRQYKCKSHYYIDKNKVTWLSNMR